MKVNSSLPIEPKNNRSNDKKVNQFFDSYFTKKLEFSSNEVTAVKGFFEKRGFSATAASAVSLVLLQQAKIDKVKVFALLDTMKNFSQNQLSDLVTEILNHNRLNTSVLGLRNNNSIVAIENRNIIL